MFRIGEFQFIAFCAILYITGTADVSSLKTDMLGQAYFKNNLSTQEGKQIITFLYGKTYVAPIRFKSCAKAAFSSARLLGGAGTGSRALARLFLENKKRESM